MKLPPLGELLLLVAAVINLLGELLRLYDVWRP